MQHPPHIWSSRPGIFTLSSLIAKSSDPGLEVDINSKGQNDFQKNLETQV
jgi:hypothetical protein